MRTFSESLSAISANLSRDGFPASFARFSAISASATILFCAPDFAAENGGTGPYGYEVPRRGMNGAPAVVPGDVVQLADEAGDFYHTLFITGVEGNEIFVAAHSDDALDRRLSTYRYATARFLHIAGARVDVGGYDCFDALISGEALPVMTGV